MKKITTFKKMLVIMLCAIIFITNTGYAYASSGSTGGLYKITVGWKKNSKGFRYVYNTKGAYCKGGFYILYNSNKMYRFDKYGYVMNRKTQYIKGLCYDGTGAIDATHINSESKNYIHNEYNDGTSALYITQWKENSRGYYFMDYSFGWQPKNQSLMIDGKTYWFDKYGYMLTKKNGSRVKPGTYTIVKGKTLFYTVKVYTKGTTNRKLQMTCMYNTLRKNNNATEPTRSGKTIK